MLVSGNGVTKNSPTDTGEKTDVLFALPNGGDLAKVKTADAKVSLNGNLLAHNKFAVATKTVGGHSYFEVTNMGATKWHPNSTLVVECPYPAPIDQSIENLMAVLNDHELRITALETPVTP